MGELISTGLQLYVRPPARMLLDLDSLSHDEILAMMVGGSLQVGGGMGPVDSVEASILNHAVNKATWTPPASYYLGVSTTTPTDAAGNFTEPSGGSYARVNIVTADWNSASGTAPTVVTNANAIAFPAATGSWGALTHGGLFAASSGGSPLWLGALTATATVNTGGTLSFAAGQIVFQLGEPSDSY